MKKLTVFLFVSLILLIPFAAGQAYAAEDVDLTVEVVVPDGAGYVVMDEMDGVEARYRTMSFGDVYGEYSCAGYVKAYYMEVHGIDVQNLMDAGPPSPSELFVEVSAPRKGDIIFYAAPPNRNNHSAIVKSFDGGRVTLIEQNFKWAQDGGTYTYLNRTIPFSENGNDYEIWRLASENDLPEPAEDGEGEDGSAEPEDEAGEDGRSSGDGDESGADDSSDDEDEDNGFSEQADESAADDSSEQADETNADDSSEPVDETGADGSSEQADEPDADNSLEQADESDADNSLEQDGETVADNSLEQDGEVDAGDSSSGERGETAADDSSDEADKNNGNGSTVESNNANSNDPYNNEAIEIDSVGGGSEINIADPSNASGGINNGGTVPAFNPEPSFEAFVTIGGMSINVNGVDMPIEAPALIENNHTVMPVRFIGNALGLHADDLYFDENTRTVFISNNGSSIIFTIDSNIMIVNQAPVQMDCSAFIRNNYTYLPLKYLAEALGVQYEWNAETQTAKFYK